MISLHSQLEQHLSQVTRLRDPYLETAGHFFVKEYIAASWSQYGQVKRHPFQVRAKNYENLILDLPPQTQVQSFLPPVLIGAHYDAFPGTPGADDNATGIAALLALVQHFGQTPAMCPLRFVAFDLEEYGLCGSRAYAHELKRQGQKLRLMLSLEMLGYCDHRPHTQQYPRPLNWFYPSQGDFVALIGNLPTIGDLIHFHRQFHCAHAKCEWLVADLKGRLVPDIRRSDHAPFWDLGYRAILVTDTAHLRNPHYHQSSDTLETIDLDFLSRNVQGLIEALQHFR